MSRLYRDSQVILGHRPQVTVSRNLVPSLGWRKSQTPWKILGLLILGFVVFPVSSNQTSSYLLIKSYCILGLSQCNICRKLLYGGADVTQLCESWGILTLCLLDGRYLLFLFPFFFCVVGMVFNETLFPAFGTWMWKYIHMVVRIPAVYGEDWTGRCLFILHFLRHRVGCLQFVPLYT